MKTKKQSRSNEADELTIEDVVQLGGDQVGARNGVWISIFVNSQQLLLIVCSHEQQYYNQRAFSKTYQEQMSPGLEASLLFRTSHRSLEPAT